ncbi:MAG: tRNA (uridine(54)-C5)-methyltransferase TrmA [Snodgrassella sp.]|uniref:tRNA (uridine(54)-C5)-methyltransferase TrmA n=1 Tax=Snodgrassella sp. TaxID=2815304 RepID=UPI00258E200D|nr:tRNA (uridine(54)-C5)-methyltransferase TrmA [Snodgrassella sp.]MCO6507211.1 tRNA (uridine(54)-C5)-methyltransferase TrmA [Snodgrassella sp.]
MTTAAYQQQLSDKQLYLEHLFADCAFPPVQVFTSPASHYRMRAEFRIWHDGDECSYAMFTPGEKASAGNVHKLCNFSVAHENINSLMPKLLDCIQASELLKARLFQVEFLTTLAGDTLVTLIYHKKLDDGWMHAASKLAAELGVQVLGRSRGQKVVLERDYVIERLNVNQEIFQYKQLEGGFTQPNAEVCQSMLSWAVNVAQTINTGDLLELYCGNGNFTLPLSRHFRRVLATEVSKTSVQAARWNIAINQITNIALARLSAEEFTEAYTGVRTFQRLASEHINLADYQFSSVFVDPPRAGIDQATLELLQKFDNIIYVSCNPVTLHENLQILLTTHEVKRAAMFDQFPFTPHIESGVWLKKR